MNDYRTYQPTEEAVKSLKDKYKSYNKAFSDYNTNLLVMCMMPQENRSNFDFSQTLMGIRYNLMGIAEKIRYNAAQCVIKEFEKDGKVTFSNCGWTDNTEEEISNRAIKELVLIACVVKTPDYFENGNNFYDKRTAIEENVDLFVEEMEDLANKELMEYFAPYKVEEEDEEDDI